MTEREYGGNLEGEEPTPQAQEHYYQLSGAEAALTSLLNEAEKAFEEAAAVYGPGIVLSAVEVARKAVALAYDLSKKDMDAFLAEHTNTKFKVFRPEDVEAAFDNDVERWDVIR